MYSAKYAVSKGMELSGTSIDASVRNNPFSTVRVEPDSMMGVTYNVRLSRHFSVAFQNVLCFDG